MEVKAERGHAKQVTCELKRFSKAKYPSHETMGEEALKVKGQGSQEGCGYQHYYCLDCNEHLKLEPLGISNVHQNIPQRELKYSVLEIGVKCPKCKKTNMIKISFDCQFIVREETAKYQDHKHDF